MFRDNYYLTGNFIEQLQNYFSKDIELTAFTDEKTYSLELQKNRMEKYGIRLENKLNEVITQTQLPDFAQWKDDKYNGRTVVRPYKWTETYYKNNEVVFSCTRNRLLYGTLVDINDSRSDKYEEDSYACPNCGNPSKVGELRSGCKYCGTHFEVGDLFPKISNYYILENPFFGYNVKKHLGIIFLVCTLRALLEALVVGFFTAKGAVSTFLHAFIAVFIIKFIFGNIIVTIIYFIVSTIKKFVKAFTIVPAAGQHGKSHVKFEENMKIYSSEFSYQYFTSRIAALVELIIFSEDSDNLPTYKGEPLVDDFSDIVYSEYAGSTVVKGFSVIGDYCYVTVEEHRIDYYLINDRIVPKRDVFVVDTAKNIKRKTDLNFSIKAVICPNCSGSFDATRYAECPYCSTEYDIKDEDWYITRIYKKKK